MGLPEQFTPQIKPLTNSYLVKLKMLTQMDIDKIQFDPFDHSKGDVKQLAGYASKLAVKSMTTEMDIADVMIYPHHLHEHRPDRIVLETRDYVLEKLQKKTLSET